MQVKLKAILLLSGILFSLNVMIMAQSPMASGNAQNPGPPESWEAKPPHHVKDAITTAPNGYSPAQLRHAYGFDQLSGTGAGQMIAIVDAYGSSSIQNDLNKFCDTYGIPRTTVAIYYAQGKAPKNSGWALETTLDVEWAHAIAPGAKIVLVVAKSASFSDLLGAVDYAVKLGAKQISMSWGGSEFSSETSYDSHFNKAGFTFTASSGDSGSGTMWPAASPYVVGVGGTSLVLSSSGSALLETGWSGSGGGVSAYEVKPSFQNNWQPNARRGVPDVSYDADPNTGVSVYISNYNGSTGWLTVGGTSVGAPQWAALVAISNSQRGSSLGNTDTAIYSSAVGSYSTDFRDEISGSNGGFNCLVGYDFVTGLGSPLAGQLVPQLTAY